MRPLLRARTAIVFVLVALAMAWAAPAASSDPAKPVMLSLTATLDANKMLTASGTLTTTNGQTIRDAEIGIAVGGYMAATTRTEPGGRFTISFAFPTANPGTYRVDASFAGSPGRFGPAAASASVTLTSATAGTLTVSVQPQQAMPNTLVTLTGRLLTADKKPVANALITFHAGSTLIRDSTAPTVADGTFATYLTLPDDLPAGPLTITAQFGGSEGIGQTQASTTVQVMVEPTESPSPAASPTAAASASASASPSISASASAEVSPQAPSPSAVVPERTSTTSSSVPWLVLGFVVIALFGVLVTVGLVYRERSGETARDETGGVLDDFTESS